MLFTRKLGALFKNVFFAFVLVFLGAGISSAQLKIYENFRDFNQSIILPAENSDTVFIINFWATWCKPCIDEMPLLLELAQKKEGSKFKLYLVSMDFKNQIESRLKPFIEKHNIQAYAVSLTDSKYNNWIDLVDPSWSGAIPGTLFIHSSKKYFYEGQLESVEEIEDLLKKVK